MTQRILVAVNDSPAALAAAREAVALAARLGARVRAVHVLVNGALDLVLAELRRHEAEGGTAPDVAAIQRLRGEGSVAVLRHAMALGQAAGIDLETVPRSGEVARSILEEAADWGADLIVLGRSDRVGPRQPYVGSETREVLEFAEVPVLVVPVP